MIARGVVRLLVPTLPLLPTKTSALVPWAPFQSRMGGVIYWARVTVPFGSGAFCSILRRARGFA